MNRSWQIAWLAGVMFLAGWDSASFVARPATFGAYAAALDVIPAEGWAVWLGLVSLAAAAGAVWTAAGRTVAMPVLVAVALSHGFICAMFGWSIFSGFGWPGGTGAWKWIVWAVVDSVALGSIDHARHRPGAK